MSTIIKIAPSILSADFARLGEQVAEAERDGADLDAGANVLVAGSAIFSADENITTAIQRIREMVSSTH